MWPRTSHNDLLPLAPVTRDVRRACDWHASLAGIRGIGSERLGGVVMGCVVALIDWVGGVEPLFELAPVLGIEEGAVKVRVHRARRRLKELLEEGERHAGEL